MQTTSLTIDELYQELAALAREEGVTSREMWNEMVEEVVEGHVDLGELDADQDIEGMKEILGAKWLTYKEEAAEEESGKDEYEEDTTTRVDEKEEKNEDEDKDADEIDGLNQDDDDTY